MTKTSDAVKVLKDRLGLTPIGRKKEYTNIGIRRKACVRCGKKSDSQWAICSNDNLWVPLCWKCDVVVNRAMLKLMRFPNWQGRADLYEERMKTQYGLDRK